MCRACDAADARADAAKALKDACQGPRIVALRTVYQPDFTEDEMAEIGAVLDRMIAGGK